MTALLRICFVALALTGALPPNLAAASELVMFERRGCIWCQRWDRDVAPAYDKTDEAQRLPLRRVDIERSRSGDVALKEPVIYTPTFVVVGDDGREVGRVTGYIDNATFWGLLDMLMTKLPSSTRTDTTHAARRGPA